MVQKYYHHIDYLQGGKYLPAAFTKGKNHGSENTSHDLTR